MNARTCAELSSCLQNFDAPYHFERPEERNLLHWHQALNTFDSILERFVSQHDVMADAERADGPKKGAEVFGFASGSGDVEKSTRGQSGASSTRADKPATPTLTEAVSPVLVRFVLRATLRLVRNASYDTRNVYSSVEHIGALLADDQTGIVLLSLEILNTLLQRSPKLRPTRAHMNAELSDRLYDLAIGWGGRESGLGLVDCCSATNEHNLPAEGNKLHFEYVKAKSTPSSPQTQSDPDIRPKTSRPGGIAATATTSQPSSGAATPIPVIVPGTASAATPVDVSPGVSAETLEALQPVPGNGASYAIHLDNVESIVGKERWLLTEFAQANGVPREQIFSLMVAFRRARVFSEGRTARIEMTVLRLLAITTLSLLQPLPHVLSELFQREPELIAEIVALARADAGDGLQDIPKLLRVAAVRCLTAMASDRHRLSQILVAAGVGSLYGVLPTLLRAEISSLLSSARTPQNAGTDVQMDGQDGDGDSDPGCQTMSDAQAKEQMDMEPRPGVESASGLPKLKISDEYDRSSALVQSVHMTEAVLTLVHSIATSAGSTGASALVSSGILSMIVPLLNDRDPRHNRAVAQAIRAMQCIIESTPASAGSQVFRDHDGLSLVAHRITLETTMDSEGKGQAANSLQSTLEEQDELVENAALKERGESRELYARLGSRQMTLSEALKHPAPSSTSTSRGTLPHSKWALLRALHQLLQLALGNGGNQVRDLVVNTSLPRALRHILARPFYYGGSLFSSAAQAATDIAHAEPTATGELVKAGISAAVLRSVRLGLPPSGEAVRCVPQLLAAICLSRNVRDDIVTCKPLRTYLLRLATPFYSRALQGQVPEHIGTALDELMRHVEALRPGGNEAMIEYLKLSAEFVKTDTSDFAASSPSTASERPAAAGGSGPVGTKTDSSPSVRESASGTTKKDGHAVAGDSTPSDTVLLERMKLAVANNAARLAGFGQGSIEHQTAMVQNGGLERMLELRSAAALASPEASMRDGHQTSRSSPTPGNTIVSLVTSLRNFSSRHGTHVLRFLFDVIREDAAQVLQLSAKLDGAWLPEEDRLTPTERKLGLLRELPRPVSEADDKMSAESVRDRATDMVETEAPAVDEVTSARENMRPAGTSSHDGEVEAVQTSGQDSSGNTRLQLNDALCKLRVDVVLLSGLSRGGPGSSVSAWEAAGGSQVAAIISAVERAARYHLTIVYTGLTLSTQPDGDLCTARVTAAVDPSLQPVRADQAHGLIRQICAALGEPTLDAKDVLEAVKSCRLPRDDGESPRQDVKGLAWSLVTFAVATQRLYSVLSRGLTYSSSRRNTRDPTRYAASAQSLAATIGRVFVLHLIAAESLWERKVLTMGQGQVVAAWDYVRGVLIEIKGALFDESRRVTQTLILRAFMTAGGVEALQRACRPALLVLAARLDDSRTGMGTVGSAEVPALRKKIESIIKSKSLTVSSIVLAANELLSDRQLKEASKGGDSSQELTTAGGDAVEDAVMTTGPFVTPSTNSSVKSPSLVSRDADGVLLYDANDLKSKRKQIETTSSLVLEFQKHAAVQQIASDAWNTLSSFMHLFASCPGLLGAPPTPVPPETGSRGVEWEPRDIQRSAQAAVLRMLTDVTREPEHLLSAFRPDGSAMADIIAIAHTASQTATNLCQRSAENDPAAEHPESEEPDGLRVEFRVRRSSPDPVMLRSLVEMGFPERRASAALQRSPSRGLEYAMEWLLSHPQDEVESDESGGEDEGGDEGGDEGEDDSENSGGEGDDGEPSEPAPVVSLLEGEEAALRAFDDSLIGVDDTESTGGQVNGDGEPEVPPPALSTNAGNSSIVNGATGTRDGAEQAEISADAEAEVAPVGTQASSPRASRKKSDLKKEAGASPKTDVLGTLESEGERLVNASIDKEMVVLASALLRVTKIIPPESVADLQAKVGALVSWEPKPPAADANVVAKSGLVQVNPTSIESYKETKRLLFDSLAPVVRMAIANAPNDMAAAHMPFIAVELLSILQKDGGLSDDTRLEFAKLLVDGLSSTLSITEKSSAAKASNMIGHVATVWAHYGGSRAREVLESCGAPQLAYKMLNEMLVAWNSVHNDPTVDEEATRPIQQLSINEDEVMPAPAGSEEDGRSNSRKRPAPSSRIFRLCMIRPEQARLLKRMNTCLLILDAFVRYSKRDETITCAEAMFGDASEGTAMKDVDEDSSAPDSLSDRLAARLRTGESGGSGTEDRTGPSGTASALDELMREFFGAATNAMEVEAEQVAEAEENIAKLEDHGVRARTEAVSSAEKEIRSWLTPKKSTSPSVSKVSLVSVCVELMRLWKGLEVGDAVIALLQLIASLTTAPKEAIAFLEQGGVELLLEMPHLESHRARSSDYRMARILARTILKHVVEDEETLKEAMIADLRSILTSGQSRGRASISLRNLLGSAGPLIARSISAFVFALGSCARARDEEANPSGGSLEATKFEALGLDKAKVLMRKRKNVISVIASLCGLLAEKEDKPVSGIEKGAKTTSNVLSRTHDAPARPQDAIGNGLAAFALSMLSELVEFSPVVAVAFLETPSPCALVSGSALDFVVQRLLPIPQHPATTACLTDPATAVLHASWLVQDEISEAARSLVLGLCSKTANAHEAVVRALATAAKMEADKTELSSGMIKGIAQCIIPNTKLRVLRALLQSEIANDLARSLHKLDLSQDQAQDVSGCVLRALALIGQTATHISRHGDNFGEDDGLVPQSREPWAALREEPAQNFMVI